MNMAMTLLSACADNNLGTDTERESVIPEQNQKALLLKNSLKNQINIQNTGKRFKIYLASELFCIFLMIY